MSSVPGGVLLPGTHGSAQLVRLVSNGMKSGTAGVIALLGVLVSACSSEMAGAGTGVRTAPDEPVLVTALGDSIPAATNCDGCSPFVDLFAARIEKARAQPVDVANLGIPGATSTDLLDSLVLDADVASVVRASSVLTVTIGANDFFPDLDEYMDGDCGESLACFDDDLDVLNDTLDAVLRVVGELRPSGMNDVLVTGYWNVFPDGEVAEELYGSDFVRDSAVLTTRANAVIEATTSAAGATYVGLVAPFKGTTGTSDPTSLLTDDGDHPNQAGHEAISAALWSAWNEADHPAG